MKTKLFRLIVVSAVLLIVGGWGVSVGAQEPREIDSKNAQTVTDIGLKFPFLPGKEWKTTAGWEAANHQQNWNWYAVDFIPASGSCKGESVIAAAPGYVRNTDTGAGTRFARHEVEIDHGDFNGINYRTLYVHLDTITVADGEYVSYGTQIGTCGDWASPLGAHIHFQLYQGPTWNANDGIIPVPIDGIADQNRLTSNNTGLYSSNQADTTAPTTTASPSGTTGANGWYRSNVQVTLTATDNSGGSGVKLRQYKIGDGAWQTYSSPFTISTNGTTTIFYRSQDNADNWETAKTLTFKIDTVAPALPSSVSPGCTATHNIWQNTCNDANFTWSGASDATSGVDSYHYYWGTDSAGTSTTSTSGTTYNPGAVNPGTYYLRLRTKDKAGNWSAWQTLFTLRYDDVSPTGVFSNPADTLVYSIQPLLGLSGSDAHSGLDKAEFSNDGQTWTGYSYAAQIPWSLSPLDETWQTVHLRTVDKAGNKSSNTSKRFCFDANPSLPASENYRLISVHNASGGVHTSGQFRLSSTVGQAFQHNQPASNSYNLQSGFQAMLMASLNDDLYERDGCVADLLGPLSTSIPASQVYLPVVLK